MICLNSLFTENVVLQAEKSCKISGTAQADSEVTLSLGAYNAQTYSDDKGNFTFDLPSRPYNMVEKLTIHSAGDQQSLTVQFGDVFLFAGQSNMEYRMENEDHFQEEQQNFNAEGLFFHTVNSFDYDDGHKRMPDTLEEQSWKKLTKSTLKQMSAIAYYTIKEHRKKYPDRIIGAVICSKGGTSASCWISEDDLAESPAINQAVIEPYRQAIDRKKALTFQMELMKFWESSETFYKKREKLIQKHPELTLRQIKEQIGFSPWPPPANPYLFTRPSGLYYTMFKKIVPFTFSAVVWYQGEEDAGIAPIYQELLHLLIKQWREELGDQVPFYIVQLPVCEDRPGHDWATVREAQRQVSAEIERGYLVTSLDCGEVDDIHPTDKSILGRRIGEVLDRIYYTSCPVAKVRSWKENRVVIEVDHTRELRLLARDSITSEQAIEAITIEENRVIIQSKEKLNKVEYGWSNAPSVTLFNEVGYPVSPFSFKKT